MGNSHSHKKIKLPLLQSKKVPKYKNLAKEANTDINTKVFESNLIAALTCEMPDGLKMMVSRCPLVTKYLPIWREEFEYDDAITSNDLDKLSTALQARVEKVLRKKGEKAAHKEIDRLGVLTLKLFRKTAMEREEAISRQKKALAGGGRNQGARAPDKYPRCDDVPPILHHRPNPPRGPPDDGSTHVTRHENNTHTSPQTSCAADGEEEEGEIEHEGETGNDAVFSFTSRGAGDPSEESDAPPVPSQPGASRDSTQKQPSVRRKVVRLPPRKQLSRNVKVTGHTQPPQTHVAQATAPTPPAPPPNLLGVAITAPQASGNLHPLPPHSQASATHSDSLIAPMIAYPTAEGGFAYGYRKWYNEDVKNTVDTLPDIQSHPESWQTSVIAEVLEQRLNTREARDLITACCPKAMKHQITQGAQMSGDDGLPHMCMNRVPAEGDIPAHEIRNPSHKEAVDQMVKNALALAKGQTDLSLITSMKQAQTEDVTDFIRKFTVKFDRFSGLTPQSPGYTNLLVHLLVDALRPHIKQAIVLHEPMWKSKNVDEITTLAAYYQNCIESPKPRPKFLASQDHYGQVTLRKADPNADKYWRGSGTGNGGRRSSWMDQDPNAGNTQIHGPLCWSCGERGHISTYCYSYDNQLPYKPQQQEGGPGHTQV